MFNFITRYFSSFWNLITIPFVLLYGIVKKIFPNQEITTIELANGSVSTYEKTSFWRFTTFSGKVFLFIWLIFSTYVFVYHRPLLQKQAIEIEQIKQNHERQMQDLKTYLKKYNDLAHKLNIIDDKILNNKKKIADTEKESLIKQKLNTWGQLDFLYTHINEVFQNTNYSPKIKELSKLYVEYELTKSENELLKKNNKDLSENMLLIEDTNQKMYTSISKITENGIEELKNNLKTINKTLSLLGLTQDQLIKKANRFSNNLVGASFVPIELNEKIDSKYQKLADKIEVWNGLARLNIILPLGKPVDKTTITSYFGIREDPFTKKLKKHNGIDFRGNIGTELKTVAPGRVISVGDRVGYGTTVEVDHGLGFTTLYAHLSKTLVSRGDWINKGTIIGLAGSSGRSTGPHLHYEIRFNGRPFDPITFVKE